jgi:hypothetical protein
MKSGIIGLLLLLTTMQQALAWGPEGHSIIAEIAQRRLSKSAADAIAKYLAPKPDTPVLALPSLASVASWADDFRAAHPETGAWHFIDAPLNETIDMTRDCPAPKGCVVSQLEKLKNDLRCPDPAKLEALKFAVHLIGDVHQPFHTVDEGGGGNSIHVHMLIPGKICENRTCLVAHEWQNLHEVWDSTLINKTVFAWGAYVDSLEQGWLKTSEAGTESGGTPLDWANETHALAKKFWVADAATLDQSYYKKAQPVLDKQLGRAGVRLARFLNDAYAATTCPMQ